MKKYFVLLICLIMVLSVTLQASAFESAPPKSADTSPVTLTVAAYFSPVGNQFGILTDPVSQQIKKETGITVKAIDAGDSSDWGTRLNALIASNDLPDIFYINDTAKQIPMLVKSNQILALDKYITPKLAPTLSSDSKAQAAIMLSKKTMYTDGNLYTVSLDRGTYDNGTGPLVGDYLRWDLYKKLGYPKINNYDDLLAVLKKMQDLEPKTKEGKKVYAIGTFFGDNLGMGDWLISNSMPYSTGNLYLTGDRTITADISNNDPSTTCALQDKNSVFWQSINFYYKANKLKILDPSSFTQKYSNYQEKENSGQYLYLNPSWETPGINANYFKKNNMPEKGFAFMPAPNTDKQVITSDMIGGERQVGVSANTKYPERCIQLLDWISSYRGTTIALNGIQGEYWDVVNGKPTPKKSLYDGSVKSSDMVNNSGMGVFNHFVGYANGTIDPTTGNPVSLANSPEAISYSMPTVQKDQLAYFGTNSLLKAYTKNLKAYQNKMIYNLGSLPDNLQTYETNLVNYEFKNMFKLMMAKNDAEFTSMQNKFIKDLNNFNVNKIYKYWYDKAKQQQANLKPVLDLYNKK